MGVVSGSSWLMVRWDPDSSQQPVVKYLLEYKLAFVDSWTMLNVTQFMTEANITGLYPNGLYQVCPLTASHSLTSCTHVVCTYVCMYVCMYVGACPW